MFPSIKIVMGIEPTDDHMHMGLLSTKKNSCYHGNFQKYYGSMVVLTGPRVGCVLTF